MHSFNLRSLTLLIAALALANLPSIVLAQQAKPAASATAQAHATPTQISALRGHVADQSEAVIPGAAITVLGSNGVTIKSATSDSTGNFVLTGLTPGSYSLQVTFPGFAPFLSGELILAPGQSKRIDVVMAIEAEQQVVTVTEDASLFVNTDAGSNASAIVLRDKALDALSDDPDELADELSALAGPSAGPNGGSIYIDGFSDGQLPPKSSIREIRVNQNPFSAEFDKLGFARVEILTKPGTDKLHGRVFSQGNDKSFNTGNPFTTNVPGYHTFMVSSNLTGSIGKSASFNLSADYRNIADANVYTAQTANGLVTGGLSNPHTRINVSPRLDWQIGDKNTLTVRYQFYRDVVTGNLSNSKALPSQATGATQSQHQIQISDSITLSDHAVNETRIQWARTDSNNTSVSTKPSISASGFFAEGGSTQQFSNSSHSSLEIQNATTMSLGAQALKFGARLRYYTQSTNSSQNFNGSFSFNSDQAYKNMLTDLNSGKTFADLSAVCAVDSANCHLPNTLSFTLPASSTTLYPAAPKFEVNLFDLGLYLEDDWKVNRFLTLSGGLRWESQNKINDHSDWGPRVALAYALDGHKAGSQTKTVLRAGYGFFYDRFSLNNVLRTVTQGGGANSLTSISITNPTCFYADKLPSDLASLLTACGAVAKSSSSTLVKVDQDYKSPLTQQFSASLERQLTKTASLSVTYLRSFGLHQLVTIDANPLDPASITYANGSAVGTRINAATYGSSIVNEYLPGGVFKQNQIISSVNAKFTKNFSVTGFYTLSFANTNAAGSASNSFNLDQDYGRASFASRHSLMLMSSYKGPWGISFNPFLVASSGKPYNITVNKDLTGDKFNNNRPAWANATDHKDTSLCSTNTTGRYVLTSFGCFDVLPTPGYTPIPINLGNGPAMIAVNMRVNRAFGIGPKLASATNSGEPGMPGSTFGGMGGPGGGGRGGHGGPPAGSSSGRKYSLQFTAEINNLFNNVNYANPSGSIAATKNSSTGIWGPGSSFGVSSALAGGRGQTNSSAVRRITFQASFSF